MEAGGLKETLRTNDTVSDMGAEAGSSSGIAVAIPKSYIKDSMDIMEDGSLKESYTWQFLHHYWIIPGS